METSRRRRSSSGPKVERKVVEKNRRELQKGLYAQLHSLLPPTPHGLNHMEEVTMPLPDQIDEAVKHIKNMKTKVDQMKEKKENLLRTSSSTLSSSHLNSSSSFDFANNIGIPDQPTTSSRAQTKPMVEIQDMGPSMDVIVVTGLGRVDMFYDIIQLLHQEHGVDVANASFSLHGNSLIQIIHKMGKEITGFEAETLSRKLESLIYGSSSSCCDNYLLEMKQLQFWEFDEQLDTILWGVQPFQFDDNSVELE